jgi:hypothetical protein
MQAARAKRLRTILIGMRTSLDFAGEVSTCVARGDAGNAIFEFAALGRQPTRNEMRPTIARRAEHRKAATKQRSTNNRTSTAVTIQHARVDTPADHLEKHALA